MDLGKIIGLIVFISVLIVQFAMINNFNGLLQTTLNQINSTILILFTSQPKIGLVISNNQLILTFNNTLNFPITLLNVTGDYTYLSKPVTINPNEVKNISVVVTNLEMFERAIHDNSYNLTIVMKMFNTTFSQSEMI
ncbi:hypothetical protein SULI_14175 [Saccharolobus solfataricus]|uniref:Uncharacterized protein n=4 Tax=Saccharolobus TaxID=2100760 RepID=Q97X03_SACS2|nr:MULTISPECIES: hypothetical protein [Sulfolobaceae]AAK42148.1 Hypothetical protein SSO1957 [Saccharolobus solfataricus P2]ACP49454.1 conserved hypothetical protein [Sulfolobus islandicus Y.N.15.51]AKA74843.1 hypothetical protein SULB_2783 [Saccharolobus solfataricus]AKA77539.1 hypothetical protein SULC_2780 [Saccharolobus solfataricus]AKA80229.1 hypothetical protein SULA_2782 [Saccharolobus solfataricus]